MNLSTRFNEIPIDGENEYTQQVSHIWRHTDKTKARFFWSFRSHRKKRIRFIPFPLGVILVKALYHSLSFTNFGSIVLFIVAYLCLFTWRVLNTICTLGKACDIITKHQDEKMATQQISNFVIKQQKSSVTWGKVDMTTSPMQQTSPTHSSLESSFAIKSKMSTLWKIFPFHLYHQLRVIWKLKMDLALGVTASYDVDLEDVGNIWKWTISF